MRLISLKILEKMNLSLIISKSFEEVYSHFIFKEKILAKEILICVEVNLFCLFLTAPEQLDKMSPE